MISAYYHSIHKHKSEEGFNSTKVVLRQVDTFCWVIAASLLGACWELAVSLLGACCMLSVSSLCACCVLACCVFTVCLVCLVACLCFMFACCVIFALFQFPPKIPLKHRVNFIYPVAVNCQIW